MDWERLKEQIAQNKAALDELTAGYMSTQVGRFVVEDYLTSLRSSAEGSQVDAFIRNVAAFEKSAPDNIDNELRNFLRPPSMTEGQWQQTLNFVQ